MQKLTQKFSRRSLLKAAPGIMASVLLTGSPISSYAIPALNKNSFLEPPIMEKPPLQPKLTHQKIAFFHTHTQERLTITHLPGQCALDTRNQVDYFLRDFRTGDQHPMDTSLLDTLYFIQDRLKGRGVFEVISGYRSLKTNQFLLKRGTGVAKNSLHMQGRAIDVRLSGLHTTKLRDTAIDLGMGGVGYYPHSNFVHLDTGNFRTW